MLLSAASFAAAQSLVATVDSDLQVAASYGYSQVHHDGEWIRVDVGVRSQRNGTIRLHKAFSLLTPDGERIDLPSQQEYRAGIDEIQAMQTRAANMQLPPMMAFSGGGPRFGNWTDVAPVQRRAGKVWKLWGNGGVDWAASIGPTQGMGTAALYFKAPEWPAGEYWLLIDGPGDLEARLPVRLH